jgi:hypothetical protein
MRTAAKVKADVTCFVGRDPCPAADALVGFFGSCSTISSRARAPGAAQGSRPTRIARIWDTLSDILKDRAAEINFK